MNGPSTPVPPEAHPARRRLGQVALVVGLAPLPWTWFLLRDQLGVVSDVIAILLPALAAVVAGVALLPGILRWRPVLVLAVSTVLVAAVATLTPWLPMDTGSAAPGSSITVASANVGPGQTESASTLLGLGADVLVVAELSFRLHKQLEPAYPHELADFYSSSVAVYSRLPFRVLEQPNADLPGVRLEIQGPAGPFILYAVHVPRPWVRTSQNPFQATVAEHHQLLEQLAGRASSEQLPVMVVGDLNMTDRGRDYRTMLDRGGLSDAMRDGWGAPTSTGGWSALLLRIDHVLVRTGWCGDGPRTYPLPGADHRGLLVTVGRCAT